MRLALIHFVLLAAASALKSAAGTSDSITVAVFDFDSAYKVKRHLVSDLVTANLSSQSQFVIVDRATLSRTLGEQALSLSGMITPETAAKVGQLTGAKILVSGRIFKNEQQWVVIAKVTGAESSRTYTQTVQGPALPNLAEQIAKAIAKTIADQSSNLLTQADTRSQLAERVLRSAKSVKRPVIQLLISEPSLGRSPITFTVETELGMVLQKAGFAIVDDKSAAKPEIEVVGNATADIAEPKGNLFSCRATLEIKVRERSTGKIIGFERQKSAGLDLGKEAALRTSLQNAADEIADRIVPLLTQ